jgi:hypothetical protein
MTTSVTVSRQTPRETLGSSASPGRLPAWVSAVFTSASARLISQPGSNSNPMRALPSDEREVELATPSTTSSEGSSTCTMARSTSSAPAPDHDTETLMFCTTVSGKLCDRIRGSALMPAAIMMTSTMLARVLCRVK